MKNIFLILLLFLSANLLFSQNTTKELIFVYEDSEKFPDYLGNSTVIPKNKPGAAVETLKLLESKFKIKITFKRTPWKRCLEHELKNGYADGAFLGSYKKEREEFGMYPMNGDAVDNNKRILFVTYSFYANKDNPFEWDGKAILKLDNPIGAPRGYSIVGDLKKMGYSNIDESQNCYNDLLKLVHKRIDLAAELEDQADYLIAKDKKFKANIIKVEPPIAKKAYFLMLSKEFYEKDPKLADEIWNYMPTLQKEYQKIVKGYFN